jgi:hypothetical protein
MHSRGDDQVIISRDRAEPHIISMGQSDTRVEDRASDIKCFLWSREVRELESRS